MRFVQNLQHIEHVEMQSTSLLLETIPNKHKTLILYYIYPMLGKCQIRWVNVVQYVIQLFCAPVIRLSSLSGSTVLNFNESTISLNLLEVAYMPNTKIMMCLR